MECTTPVEIPAAMVRALRDARHIVVLTGAGVSAPSGIPTFRDALTGLWGRFDPSKLATPDAFEADPALVTRWYDERRINVLACQPNAAHLALARIEARRNELGRRFTLVTQNVDRLHQRAGSRNVHELHGSIAVWRCTRTGSEREFMNPEPFGEYPPKSEAGGLLRPGVVWFGELLPQTALEAGAEAMESCDLFVSVGTSGGVYPAAGFIVGAQSSGIPTVEINPEVTTHSRGVTWRLGHGCDEALPRWVNNIE